MARGTRRGWRGRWSFECTHAMMRPVSLAVGSWCTMTACDGSDAHRWRPLARLSCERGGRDRPKAAVALEAATVTPRAPPVSTGLLPLTKVKHDERHPVHVAQDARPVHDAHALRPAPGFLAFSRHHRTYQGNLVVME